jgi:O-antigen/teichoic acid export membrane protein
MSLYSAARARSALIHTVGFRVVSQAATILSFIVLVRGISEHDLGIYSLLYSVIPVIGTLASLGLDQVLKRYQPEYLRAGNLGAAAWLLRRVVRLRFLVNVAAIALIVLCWQLVAPLFHLEAHLSDFELFSIVVMLNFQTLLLQSSLATHMLQKFSVGSVAVFSISKLAGYLAVTRYFEFTLQAAVLADSIAFALSYMVLAAAHLRHCRVNDGEKDYRPDGAERRRLFRYSVASHFNESSSLLLYSQTDNFFVAALMNPFAVGAYSFFTRINEMATQLIPARLFENVVQPVIYATPQDQAPERLPRYFTFLINISMVAQWPIIMMSLVYHREIIELAFGGKFIEYSLLMPIVLAFAWSENVPGLPVTILALHAERAGLILKSQLFGVYQVIAMFALIPVMGLYGAAIATGTLHLLRTLWVWWKMRHTARWLNFGAAVRHGFAIWGAAALLCYLVKEVLPMPAIAQLAVGMLVCAAGVLAFLRSGAISQSDREILANLMHGRESRLLHVFGLAPRAPALGAGAAP